MVDEKSQILLVEDDRVLGKNLKERLEKENYFIDWVTTQRECEFIKSKWSNYDLIIFDVTLPDGSGFELAKLIKKITTVPFIFMTALSEPENRLYGYELGAEEFIPKPFHLKELLLRVSHVLSNHAKEKIISINNRIIDFKSMKLRDETEGTEQLIPLRDLKVLKFLIDSSPKAVNRDEILNNVWGEDEYPSPRSIDNAIVRLRQYIKDEKGEIIKSVRGVGYQWNL